MLTIQVQGYGVKLSTLRFDNNLFIAWLCSMNAEYGNKFKCVLKEERNRFHEAVCSFCDKLGYQQESVGSIIIDVLRRVDNVLLCSCIDDSGEEYILLEFKAPWNFVDNTRNMSKDDFVRYLCNRLSMFTDITAYHITSYVCEFYD